MGQEGKNVRGLGLQSKCRATELEHGANTATRKRHE